MKVSILYHYFHPDDVISARLYGDLAKHLAGDGFEVEAVACNRGCRDGARSYPSLEEWEGVIIRRLWRPPFPQGSKPGRVINSLWMIWRWTVYLIRPFRKKPDVVIIGTDPPCSAILVNICRPFMKKTRFISWIHDLYPEAAAAAGIISEHSPVYRALYRSMTKVYTNCNPIIDMGCCMRKKAAKHYPDLSSVTITPWALFEPAEVPVSDSEVRQRLFGDAKLGLLYSGNYGLAHDAGLFIRLARLLKGSGVAFAFAVRGNCVEGLTHEISMADADIKMVPFAEDPAKHLAAADIHMVSLKAEWSGLVVPSKYFGALAAGRPVLYAGAEESDIGIWTREYGTGWILNECNVTETADALLKMADDKNELVQFRKKCFDAYHERFSRDRMLVKWHEVLAGKWQSTVTQ